MVVEPEPEEGGEDKESDDDYQLHKGADYSELLDMVANLGTAETELRDEVRSIRHVWSAGHDVDAAFQVEVHHNINVIGTGPELGHGVPRSLQTKMQRRSQLPTKRL